MAIVSTAIWEVRNTGSDNNGGGYTGNNSGNMFADGAATNATTASPSFSSASYPFVAGDVGSWVHIRSGTSWTPGWYKITAVVGGVATLSAAVGAANLYQTSSPYFLGLNTVAGCATIASPTLATWSIDRSQQNTAEATGVNLTVDNSSATNVLPDGWTPTKADVNNIIQITAGTGFTTGFYEIQNISAGKWVLDRSPAAVGTSGGTWSFGGALASVGQAGKALATATTSSWAFCAKGSGGTYTLTSTTANVSGGVFSGQTSNFLGLVGYNAIRGDNPTALANMPLFDVGATSPASIITSGTGTIISIAVDGKLGTTVRGFNGSNTGGAFFNCHAQNCTNNGFTVTNAGGLLHNCRATGCTTQPAFSSSMAVNCVADNNTGVTAFSVANSSATVGCIAIGNSVGFTAATGAEFRNCVAYNNTSNGFVQGNCLNCIAYSNQGAGFSNIRGFINCASGANVTADSTTYPILTSGLVTLSGNPFVNSGGTINGVTDAFANFALNNTANAGAACRSTGYPPSRDIGAIQHSADPGTAGVATKAKGIDIRQTTTGLVIRAYISDSTGNPVSGGNTTLSLYEQQADGTVKTFDFGNNTFTAGAVTNPLVTMTHQWGNNTATATGIWTYVLSNVAGFTKGNIYYAEVVNR